MNKHRNGLFGLAVTPTLPLGGSCRVPGKPTGQQNGGDHRVYKLSHSYLSFHVIISLFSMFSMFSVHTA